MKIKFGDIITLTFIERCDGEIVQTNIEEVARENGIYNENIPYFPIAICVGNDIFPKGLYDELIGKEVGERGGAILPPEKAYGERSDANIHSIKKKEFSKIPKIGERVSKPQYGDGIVINTTGSELIVDFNHEFVGKEFEYEYEIHDIITDPGEQFSSLVARTVLIDHETSFADGNGIICITLPEGKMGDWLRDRLTFVRRLFERHPSLDTLELREEYGTVFDFTVLDEADTAAESDEIKDGDLISFNFIDRLDGKILSTNIEQVARDNNLYDEYFKYAPSLLIIKSESCPKYIYDELIGKAAGAKGTFIIPSAVAYGLRNEKKVHSINRKEISPDAEIGSSIQHDKYGDGIIVNMFGKRVIVEFNQPFAGKDVECEYEIVERITDPTDKFYYLLFHLGLQKYTASFEHGKGIISMEVPLLLIDAWGVVKLKLALELFGNLPILQTLEFREKYEYDFDEESILFYKNFNFIKENIDSLFEFINT